MYNPLWFGWADTEDHPSDQILNLLPDSRYTGQLLALHILQQGTATG